ncbi:MAG: 6-phosphogluconate dehydrogenase NAD-binding protein [Gemmatimonadetes bacterium]|nr:6-phosphogluconate dehydrogenase NAD-binding protein [Gemmatimonadota bacterium]
MLGLGIMGGGMARRLLGAGFPLTVFNRDAGKARPFASEGATVAGSPREAAANAEIVFTMVADDGASRAMWDGERGAIAGARRGAVLVECSTVTVSRITELAAAAERAGCAFADAPVTGSKPQAAAGELTFLVGAADDTLARIRPALAVMGKTIHHLGPVTSGALVKLINNFLCGVQAASLAEAMAIIERSPLDRGRAVEAIINGSPGSPVMKTLAARMTAPDFTPNFYLHLLAKDMGYAIAEGQSRAVPMATAATALGMLRAAIDHGDGDKDMAAVVEQFRSTARA